MFITVFSDSHGNTERMEKVIERARPDAVIFLGDGIRDIKEIEKRDRTNRIYIYVRGNCDTFSSEEKQKEFEFEGIKFLILHGHTVNVRHGVHILEELAKSKNADIALFGHTHAAEDSYISDGEKPFRLFNPGSIGAGYKPTFGTITVKDSQLITAIAEYGKDAL